MALSENLKARLRAAQPLQDLATRKGLKLRNESSGWKIPCPWHNGDKTGSLHIYTDPDRGFHCFGCGKSGDVFTWLMDLEHMDFMEAVEHLAVLGGIDRTEWQNARGEGGANHTESKQHRQRILEVMGVAAAWYEHQLVAGQGPQVDLAREEAAKRQLPEDFFKTLGLGYAPDRWDGLVEHLTKQGFPLPLILATGLVGRSQSGKPYDLLRHRLVIPIRSRSGQAISFAGRFLGEGQAAKADAPKYVNGSESEVFRKGQVLYGLDRALSCRGEGRWVLVEGYFDALALQAAGIPAVATMGTAFSAAHAQEIRRGADQVVVWFDPDGPGQKATLNTIPPLLSTGLRVRVVRPMQGGDSKMDPDLVVRKVGREGIRTLLSNARSSEDWAAWAIPHLAHVHGYSRSSRQDRAALTRKMAEILAQGFPQQAPSADLVALIAAELEVAPAMVQNALAGVRKEQASEDTRRHQETRVEASQGQRMLIPKLDDLVWSALELMADGDLRGLEVVRQIPSYQWELIDNGGLVLEVTEGNGVPVTDLATAALAEAGKRRAAKLIAGNPMVLHLQMEQRVIEIQLHELEQKLNDPLLMAQPEIRDRLLTERRQLLIRKQRTHPGFMSRLSIEQKRRLE